MKRFRICPTVLLAVSVLLAFTWWHSYRSLDRMFVPVPGGGCVFFTSAFGVLGFEYRNDHSADEGELFVMMSWADMVDETQNQVTVRQTFARTAASAWILPGVRHYYYPPTGQFSCWGIMRYWQIILLLLIWPMGHILARAIPRKHSRCGLCVKCSYDLRAHKLGERCPECGTVISGSD